MMRCYGLWFGCLLGCTSEKSDPILSTDTAVSDTSDTNDTTEDTSDTGTDNDGDGFTVEDGDCNDEDPWTNPAMEEEWVTTDNDCT